MGARCHKTRVCDISSELVPHWFASELERLRAHSGNSQQTTPKTGPSASRWRRSASSSAFLRAACCTFLSRSRMSDAESSVGSGTLPSSGISRTSCSEYVDSECEVPFGALQTGSCGACVPCVENAGTLRFSAARLVCVEKVGTEFRENG